MRREREPHATPGSTGVRGKDEGPLSIDALIKRTRKAARGGARS